MTIVKGAAWMNSTQAYFQTQVSFVQIAGPGWTVIVPANPKRWYIKFDPGPGLFTLVVPLPARGPDGVTQAGQTLAGVEFKWWDCPSNVAGAWWCAPSAATSYFVTECLYIGP